MEKSCTILEVLETPGLRHIPSQPALSYPSCEVVGSGAPLVPCLVLLLACHPPTSYPTQRMQKKKKRKCLAHVPKWCLYEKHSKPTDSDFIHLLKFLYMWLICIPSCPLSHSQGQDESSWQRGRGTPSNKLGEPPPWKKQEENNESLLHHSPPATGWRELGGLGDCSHATAPVLKYKARGVKRTSPRKYSTNLSMEAKGQWARPLPSEGGRLNKSTYP